MKITPAGILLTAWILIYNIGGSFIISRFVLVPRQVVLVSLIEDNLSYAKRRGDIGKVKYLESELRFNQGLLSVLKTVAWMTK